jgi:hypothetical protein
MSIRNGGTFDVDPWEMGWNRLENNYAKYGIHNYDETQETGADLCGSPTGVVKIHDNYVENQKGAGINVGAKAATNYDCWDSGGFDIYNNVIIEAGKGPEDENGSDLHGIRIGDAGMNLPVRVFNNTIYSWGDDELGAGSGIATYETINSGRSTITISNNLLYDTRGGNYTGINEATYSNVTGSNNLFYSTGGASNSSVDSRLTDNVFDSPDFISMDYLIPSLDSVANGTGVTGISNIDILGVVRFDYDIGAYEVSDEVFAPSLIAPNNLKVN